MTLGIIMINGYQTADAGMRMGSVDLIKNGDELVLAGERDSSMINVIEPALFDSSMLEIDGSLKIAIGETLQYYIRITNNNPDGMSVLQDCTIVGNGLVPPLNIDGISLGFGETFPSEDEPALMLFGPVLDTPGLFIDTVIVTCLDQNGLAVFDVNTITTVGFDASLDITKECSELEVEGVASIQYTWTVTNDGNAPISDITTDGKITCPDGTMIDPFDPDVNSIDFLNPGESVSDSFVIDASLCDGVTGNYRNDIDVVGFTQIQDVIADLADATCNIPEVEPEPVMPIPTIDPPSVETILPRGESTGAITKVIDPDENEFFDAIGFGFTSEGDDCEESGFNDNIEKILSFSQPFVSSEEFIANDDAVPGKYHCTLNILITYEALFGDEGEIEKIVSQPVWIDIPEPNPFETEKFYTETDKDIENGFFGTLLPITDDDTQTVQAVIHPKNGKITSYNPGQYYAVTKVTAFVDLATVSIFEEDFDCTVRDKPISIWNPAKVPGGAYVWMMCPDGTTVDLTSELANADPPQLFRNDFGVLEAHVEDVKAGCMVFLGVKYSPGLKGETFHKLEPQDLFCENVEIVCANLTDEPIGIPFPGVYRDLNTCEADVTDSAHRILEVVRCGENEAVNPINGKCICPEGFEETPSGICVAAEF